jgi:hypothetical protein
LDEQHLVVRVAAAATGGTMATATATAPIQDWPTALRFHNLRSAAVLMLFSMPRSHVSGWFGFHAKHCGYAPLLELFIKEG